MRWMLGSTLLAIAAVLVAGAVSAACGAASPEPTQSPVADVTQEPAATIETPGATPSPTATVTPTPADTATPAPTSTSEPYDSNEAMYRLFYSFEQTTQSIVNGLLEIREHEDTSMVPVLVELHRYVGGTVLDNAIVQVLQELTGQESVTDWHDWMEWLGRHRDEFRPPSEYLGWKINLLSQIHPRFNDLLLPARDGSRIDLTEITWGGVAPDGIPDLQNPNTISAEEADYLEIYDRVLGVSINGEDRAYPLRIVNAHEMVNDVVGGEPIALMW